MKKSKIILIMFLILLILNINVSFVYSRTPDGDIPKIAKEFISIGKQNAPSTGKTNWNDFNDLAGMLWGIGVFAAAIAGIIIGIKYMFASLEERANIKHNMIPYLIGTIIILGALGIWKFSVEFMEGIS